MVYNRSRDVVLARDLEVARGFLARGRGLLGRDELPPGAALLIAPCGSIHTLGMRFAIDVLFLAQPRSPACCLAVARGVRPGRLGPAVRGARAVLELPAGAAGPTTAGDELVWERD